MRIFDNIVNEEVTRRTQMQVLDICANALSKSFGPMGSHTGIVKTIGNTGVNTVKYTKDGKEIMQNIVFKDPIERSVQDLLTDLTRYIVREVGDGTTSAILLCRNIFKNLCQSKFSSNVPADTIADFSNVIDKTIELIRSKGRECTLEDIYKICLISTNNNVEISETITQLYKKYGMDVFIDLGISNEVDNIVKEYDGMTLRAGFSNTCFINNKEKNSSLVKHPKVYAFNDPIDTPEMLTMLDAILTNNIYRAYVKGSVVDPIPTVILCAGKITPDASSYLNSIIDLMNSPVGDTVPLLMVSEITDYDSFEDVVEMCGAPLIRKYIDPVIQASDVEKGLAPSTETIIDFCGSADAIEADQDKTKIIKPAKMYNEDGSFSDLYNSKIKYITTELEKSKQENDSISKIGRLKRRLHSLQGSMIDFLVGGITNGDKENLKASVEDAVLNCRSAVRNGVGYGANFMGLQALTELKAQYPENQIIGILLSAYREISEYLYSTYYADEASTIVDKSLEIGSPLNIRTNRYDGSVLSSINSDIAVLQTVNRILTLMFTCNQYLVPSPMHNIYMEEEYSKQE